MIKKLQTPPPEHTDCMDELMLQNWQGYCYTACIRWVLVTGEYDWEIVHGAAVDHASGVRLNHAWCERDDIVLDLTIPRPSKFVHKDVYYKAGCVEIHERHTASEAIGYSFRNGHDGPWTEDEQRDL